MTNVDSKVLIAVADAAKELDKVLVQYLGGECERHDLDEQHGYLRAALRDWARSVDGHATRAQASNGGAL